jgi:hypothetical protein
VVLMQCLIISHFIFWWDVKGMRLAGVVVWAIGVAVVVLVWACGWRV